MDFPKLKYPRLCRILSYVVVLGCAALPILVVFSLSVPDILQILVLLGAMTGLLFYLFRNFVVLMALDMALAQLSCYRTARKQYTLPPRRSADAIRRSITLYGTKCDPLPILPQPSALRYKFSTPITVYSRGIERVVAAYEVDSLDKDTYRDILRSAKSNSKSLTGKKRAVFLDSTQKKQPLHRVTVVLILARHVEAQMACDLYKLVCSQCGDEFVDCTIPCIVDLAHQTCVFNCVRVPYVGFNCAVINRGIRIIRQRVFGGNLNLKDNTLFLAPISEINPEDTLWDFWKELRHQFIGAERKTKKRFEAMAEREIRIADEMLYLKWDQRGICQIVELDAHSKVAKVETVEDWAYPKVQPIGKKIKQQMEEHISAYYAEQGYSIEFVNVEMIM